MEIPIRAQVVYQVMDGDCDTEATQVEDGRVYYDL